MRKIFFRTFINIISVAVIIMIFVIATMSVFYTNAKNSWIEQSFDTFSQRVTASVSNSQGEMSFGKFIKIADGAALADKRISGLLFRDTDDKIIYSLGVTELGDALSQISGSLKSTETTNLEKGLDVDESEFKNLKVRDKLAYLDLEDTTVSLDFSDARDTEYRVLEFPSNIKKSYISGSLIVSLRGNYAFSVDVLSYSPSTYAATAMVVREASKWLIICFVMSMLIALILSYRFSKLTQNSTNLIKDALNKLSNGEENLVLPNDSKIEEHQEIIDTIHVLDESLSANRKSRKAWLNSITHDLNTPITSMTLLIDGMQDGIFPLTQETIKTLKKEQVDLANKINRVVLYSSLQSPEQAIHIQNNDAEVFVNDLKRANKQYEDVKFDVTSDQIYCDFTTMKLALKELIDNALKESPTGVEVIIKRNSIRVANTGTIDDSVDFFEPWERGDKSRTSGGNGLGLAIVSQVVTLHSGTAKIQQSDDKVLAILEWKLTS
ncbi:MAG: HAMP domain-containing histidine kinase [Sphaerochaetaceae bacterium]|nr:HAMP domain-containing histidine kinase [Sphaerochaetaceae bacterium]